MSKRAKTVRPEISSNLAISLDGKIATATREHFYLGTPYDRKRMNELRLEHDAILMGASTLRAYRKYSGVSGRAEDCPQPWNIVVSRKLEGIDPKWPFFKQRDGWRLLVVTEKLSAARYKAFAATSEILELSSLNPAQLRKLFSLLTQRGVHRLLVEGGGEMIWNFARYDLIDNYYVTLTPCILGGRDAPSLVQGEGFSAKDVLKLRLRECRKVGDELYLRYGRG